MFSVALTLLLSLGCDGSDTSQTNVAEPPTIEKPATVDFRVLADSRIDAGIADIALASLRQSGPAERVPPGLRWFPIHKATTFAYSTTSVEMAERNPEQFLTTIMNLIAAEHGGAIYVLAWDTPEAALTAAEKTWAVLEAFPFGKYDLATDSRPDSVVFTLDKHGGKRLNTITAKHIGRLLTIVIEGKLYAALKIAVPMKTSGVITGGAKGFSQLELTHLSRLLVGEPAEPPQPAEQEPKDAVPAPTTP